MKKNILLSILIISVLMVTTFGVVSANSVPSSTIVFQGPLTDDGDGSYSGTIPVVQGGGFDIYAKNEADAIFTDDTNPIEYLEIVNHDAWPAPEWDPDTPDWEYYQLTLDGDNWYIEYNVEGDAKANPMSGNINWNAMYAFETGIGAYYPGKGTSELDDGLGGHQAWDMDWSWGSEYVPLEYPGFDVHVEEVDEGYYEVTFTPAETNCVVTIDEPGNENIWFDSEAVNIEWHLSETCPSIVYSHLYYYKSQDGECSTTGPWYQISYQVDSATTSTGSPFEHEYLWDKPTESGLYCVYVEVHSSGVKGYSEVFKVDQTPPEVSLYIGDNNVGECDEEETGDCYVNQQTPITLSCEDNVPPADWQSGVNRIEYKYSWLNGTLIKDWTLYDGPFSFHEDSEHLLEYRCYDNVDKVDTESKEIIVDTQAPEITKVLEGVWIGDCPPTEEGDVCHISTSTHIIATGTDPIPHPVNQVECRWGYILDGYEQFGSGFDCYGNVCDIDFPEDTQHELYVTCKDALENTYRDEELFLVDGSAPTTTVDYTGPEYGDFPKWIDTESRVVLNAIDNPQQSVCAVDDVTTYYRVEQVENEWCYGTSQDQWQETSKEAEGWIEYLIPFGIEESCHAIEYYSVDALGNSEDVQVEFVFSDHTAPTLNKEVGKPSHDCNGVWEILNPQCEEGWEWIVTMETPITLSCEDQGDHPSGLKELCYRISWDGEIQYGEGSDEEGWTCVPYGQLKPIYFNEECEHTLEFYCVDNVEKTSEIDTEVFKVKGTSKEIELDKKWNLISVPFNLLSDDVEEVFADISADIESVWSYEDGEWLVYYPDDEASSTLDRIIPGRGYWVKTADDTSLLVGGELLSEGPVLPSSIELDKGWNLIGHYGLVPKMSYCSLFSLVDTQEGHPRWSALYGYNSNNDYFVPLNTWSFTNPGKGYWVEMDVEDSYSPATACWGAPMIP